MLSAMSPLTSLSWRARPLATRPRVAAVLLATILASGLAGVGLTSGSATPAAAHGTGTQLDAAGLEAMIYCESLSHGRYRTPATSRAPFWGAVQWVQSTWNHATVAAGYPEWSGKRPNQAPPEIQDAVTYDHWSKSSPDQQWPVCHARAMARIGTGDPGPYRVCGDDEWSTGPWSRAHPETCATYTSAASTIPEATPARTYALRGDRLHGGRQPITVDATATTVLVCDVDGDGTDEAVTRSGANWSVDLDHRGGRAELTFRYGRASDVALCGDIDGDGSDDPVVVRGGRSWYARRSWSGGRAQKSFSFGRAGDIPLLCDTDGDGTDELVVVRRGVRFVDADHRGRSAEVTVGFGRRSDTHLCGDLDADGIDDMVVARSPNTWFARRTWTRGAANDSFAFGRVGDQFLIG